jgi:hypothetical protein
MNYNDLHLVYNRNRYSLPPIKEKPQPVEAPVTAQVVEQPMVVVLQNEPEPVREHYIEYVPAPRLPSQIRTIGEIALGWLGWEWLNGTFRKEVQGDPNQHVSDHN